MNNLYYVEYRSGSMWFENPESIYRYMECKSCSSMVSVADHVVAIVCSECIQEQVEPPVIRKSTITAKYPAGWESLDIFVDTSGNVYYKGELQPNLKDTLPTTLTNKPKVAKLSKAQKQKIMDEAASNIYKLKKQLPTAKFKKDIAAINREIKKYTRIAKGKIPKQPLN
jgi:hypothetical protein